MNPHGWVVVSCRAGPHSPLRSSLKAPLGEVPSGLVMGECSDSKAHICNSELCFFLWPRVTFQIFMTWKKRIRTVDLGCGRVGATVSGMLFVHRIPVSYAKHKTSASSTPKIRWQFDLWYLWDAWAQVMICLRLQVLPCDYLGVSLLCWLMFGPIHFPSWFMVVFIWHAHVNTCVLEIPRKNTHKCSFKRFLFFERFFSTWA